MSFCRSFISATEQYTQILRLMWYLWLWLGLSSCTIDKQYSLQQPVAVSKQWSTKDPYLVKPLSDAHRFAWWRQYHDPFLNKLIAEGMKHNNDIKIAMANIEAAEGELKRVELNWLPTLTGNLGYLSFPYLGYPGVLALMAVPLYTVNVFNQIKSQQYAYYSLKVTKSMRDGVKLTVIANIAAAYFSHLAHALRINMKMYTHGIASNIDVNVARARLNMVQGEEKIIEKNLILTQNALRYLINQNPNPFICV